MSTWGESGVTKMPSLITTLGARNEQDLGVILPHEHIFTDLRRCDAPGYAEAEASAVVALMAPEIARAQPLPIGERGWQHMACGDRAASRAAGIGRRS